ncbi:MAG: hydantoinase/oxoprolinase family protein [Candidatus Rokubacteria bacterium]|nr:hydantoinase/oxoprolinase family protein [Candidatus Rokubacteria bacterium]
MATIGDGQGNPCVVGCDIGGTFTDIVVWDPGGSGLRVFKLLTTPQDPSEGFLRGVDELVSAIPRLPARTAVLLHATTLACNAIIERKGSRTALLTTAGFRDILEIARERRYDMHDIFITYPKPLVPRRWRIEVRERILSDGEIHVPLAAESLDEAIEKLGAENIASVAISFLHSYTNPTHEQLAADVLRAALPDVALTVSSQLLPEIGEYERTSTAVANAYVKPLMAAYLGKVEERLRQRGFGGRLYIVLSNGGLTSSALAAEYPIRVAESGPAAGAMGAEVLARRLGLDRVLSFDMGGTTAKACLVHDGRLSRAHEFEIAREARFKKGSGIALRVPVVDLLEIGAGGGSIASRNAIGMLGVGPESAGADPGPACYGRGGTAPTVTDADLVLGYLSPASFLGGRMALDVDAARTAIETSIATPLGLATPGAAWAMHDLVNENMAAAARVHFAEKAEEPAAYTLVAFGGAGPVHAAGLAWKLGIRHVIVPVSPGLFSALSFLTAPMIYEAVRTYKVPLSELDAVTLEKLIANLLEEAMHFLEVRDLPQTDWDVSLDMRYVGQGYDVSVPLNGAQPARADIAGAFDRVYERLYGRILVGVEREIINVRLAARRPLVGLDTAALEGQRPRGADREAVRRPAYDPLSHAFVPFRVAKRHALGPGTQLDAPCIVEEEESTTVLPYPGHISVDRHGNLHLHFAGAGR